MNVFTYLRQTIVESVWEIEWKRTLKEISVLRERGRGYGGE